ncbi:MAG: hypothetical protein J5379_01820 [Clostridiales bacterium]|nr:hypothetical protein [Clostridiales bacterium]
MSYFWTNLAAHLLVSFLLLLLLLWAVKNTQQNRWKKGFLYLLPFVVMVILLVQLSLYSIPRILDTTTVLRSTYRMSSGTIEKVGQFGDKVVIDGVTYYVNPFSFELEKGDEVIVKYTPYAHYAYSLELEVPEDEKEEILSSEK